MIRNVLDRSAPMISYRVRQRLGNNDYRGLLTSVEVVLVMAERPADHHDPAGAADAAVTLSAGAPLPPWPGVSNTGRCCSPRTQRHCAMARPATAVPVDQGDALVASGDDCRSCAGGLGAQPEPVGHSAGIVAGNDVGTGGDLGHRTCIRLSLQLPTNGRSVVRLAAG